MTRHTEAQLLELRQLAAWEAGAEPPDVPCFACAGRGTLVVADGTGELLRTCWACAGSGRVPPARPLPAERDLEA